MERILTCIECPIGCTITVDLVDNKITSVKGNTCKRGEIYAVNEVTCPRRIITSTIRCKNGEMLPVKTDKGVRKQDMQQVLSIINKTTCTLPINIGQVIIENIIEDINLIACKNL